ncbi:MAG TPA: SGNH/GDSL hydrolase family protein [Ruminiclostridium sp.]|nr:SGNH/GDSL hydrolase family protein [Ruminiclostridium sp.]
MMHDIKKSDENHIKMVERSLVDTGNNYRIKKAMEKAGNGLETTIAYLGGSITEHYNADPDNCFAKLSCDYFSDKYGTGNNVRYVNAGMAGTSSTIGLIRAERDVLKHKPDIIFVEFAVNDRKEKTSMVAFESLLIRLMGLDTEPAVVLVFMVSEGGYSCQNEMVQIGMHYELPMISVKDAIVLEFAEGRMEWKDYSNDYIHPHETGHQLITELIIHYFDTVGNKAPDPVYTLPASTVYGNDFAELIMQDNTNAPVTAFGGFVPDTTISQFPNGWTHKAGTAGESFIMELQCRNLFLLYKESKNTETGSADIYLDDIFVSAVNGYNSSGWNNPVVKLIFSYEISAMHRIEIKMSKGSENREFSVLAFGYSN